MAKFAIALYILLVASVTCNAQASITVKFNASDENMISAAVKAQVGIINHGLEIISAAYLNARDISRVLIQEAITVFEDQLSQFEDRMTNLTAGYGDVSSCLSSSTNLTQTAKQLFNETITCAEVVFGNVFTKYEETVNSSKSLGIKLQEIANEASKCHSWDIFCLSPIFSSKLPSVTVEVSQIVARATLFAIEFTGISTNLQVCTASSGAGVIIADSQDVYTKTKACLENLNSTST